MKTQLINFLRNTLLSILFINLPHSLLAAEFSHFQLHVGEQKTIPFNQGLRYAPSGESIRVKRTLSDGNEQLLVKGVKSGRASLILYQKNKEPLHLSFHILSTKEPLETENEKFQNFLNGLEETHVTHSDGNKIILEGEILTLSEARKVNTLSKSISKVENHTLPSQKLYKNCLKDLNQYLKSEQTHSLHIEFDEGNRWIELNGMLNSETQKKSLITRIESICPFAQTKFEVQSITPELTRLKVVLFENNQQNLFTLGFSNVPIKEDSVQIMSSKWVSHFGIISSLKALESAGKLKILSQPEIVLRTPGEAELFSGGEIPIETSTKRSSEVKWKNVGLTFKVKSLSLTSQRIKLDLFTEVSHLDPSLNSEHQPGMKLNRMKTQVEASFNEPLLISGLYQAETQTSRSGVPFVSHLPFLNIFFSQSEKSHRKTELLAILIPYKVMPKYSNESLKKLKSSFEKDN